MSQRNVAVLALGIVAGSVWWLRSTADGARVLATLGAMRSGTDTSLGSGRGLGSQSGAAPTGTRSVRGDVAPDAASRGVFPASAASSEWRAGAPGAAELAGMDTPAVGEPAAKTADGTGSRDVTPEEDAVLGMYENLASAFDQQTDDCRQLGIIVAELVRQDQHALQHLAQARATMTLDQRLQATDRLEREAGPQLSRLRRSLRIGLGKCPTEPRLQEAIRTIASAGTS
jgi:hypothetical protein